MTLIEIIIAAGILSLLLLVGFRVFRGFSQSFQKGSWSLNTQNQLRNALTFIREEMQKATSFTVANLSGTTVTEANFEFLLTSSDSLTGNGVLAKWAICLPYAADDPDSPGAIFRSELKLENGALLYSKIREDGNDPLGKEKLFSGYRVIDNIDTINITHDWFDPDVHSAGSLITFEVKVVHPDKKAHPDAHVIAQTGAKVEVEVKREL